MLKSLKNFANNGRVSPVVAKLVGIAGISIVGKASEKGTLEPILKCRGEKNSLDAIINQLTLEGFKFGKISIVLIEFRLHDVPGSATNILYLINEFNFNISYISSQEI